MRTIVKTGKAVAVTALRWSGILALLANRRLTRHVSVLTYHRVIDEARLGLINSHPGIVVSDSTFFRHMALLRNEFNLISLDQLRSFLVAGTPLPRRCCLVTFDDGWLDNYEIAFPILTEFQIPATIFLPVEFISNDTMFWQEELSMRLSWLRQHDDRTRANDVLNNLDLKRSGVVPTDEELNRFVGSVKQRSDEDVDKTLALVRDATSSYRAPHYNRYMSWDQIQEMKDAGIAFASHSMSHRILTKLPDDRCQAEIDGSRRILHEALGSSVEAIAYPNGDHDERVARLAKSAGYTMGFTTRPGLFRPGDDPFSIPRLNIHEGNAANESLFVSRCLNLL